MNLADAPTLTSPVIEGVELRDLADRGKNGWEIAGVIAPYDTPALTAEGYHEEYAPGSLTRSIRQRGAKVRLYSLHTEGVLQPIGIADHYRDGGSAMRATFRLARTTAAADARELVRSGISTGLSISFAPLRTSYRPDPDRGQIHRREEMALKHVALSPMQTYPGAEVEHVRDGQPITLDDRHAADCTDLECPGCAPTPLLDEWRARLGI